MIPSPLSLETHFFGHIEVTAQRASPEELGEGTLDSYLECQRHEEERNRWLVQLGIKKEADEKEGTPPYTFYVEAVGLFSVLPDYPEEKVESLVRVNGAAVLYGAIRELIANLTARGPYPQVDLPTVTFLDELNPNPDFDRSPVEDKQ